jgi:hypothetical protein
MISAEGRHAVSSLENAWARRRDRKTPFPWFDRQVFDRRNRCSEPSRHGWRFRKKTPSLSQAIARLVELGLTHADWDRQKLRAREMAGDTIDQMGDATTSANDRAIRKQDLLDGPKEFDRVRIDRAKRGGPIQE